MLGHIGGLERGRVPGAMQHVCQECCHQKQYFSDLEQAAQLLNHTPEDSIITEEPIVGQVISQTLSSLL